jgi:hypothetical protein
MVAEAEAPYDDINGKEIKPHVTTPFRGSHWVRSFCLIEVLLLLVVFINIFSSKLKKTCGCFILRRLVGLDQFSGIQSFI